LVGVVSEESTIYLCTVLDDLSESVKVAVHDDHGYYTNGSSQTDTGLYPSKPNERLLADSSVSGKNLNCRDVSFLASSLMSKLLVFSIQK